LAGRLVGEIAESVPDAAATGRLCADDGAKGLRTAERGDANENPGGPSDVPAAGGGGVAKGLFAKPERENGFVAPPLPPAAPASSSEPGSPFAASGASGVREPNRFASTFEELPPPNSSPPKGPLPTAEVLKGLEKLRLPKRPGGDGAA
jgi:hypothetical protein